MNSKQVQKMFSNINIFRTIKYSLLLLAIVLMCAASASATNDRRHGIEHGHRHGHGNGHGQRLEHDHANAQGHENNHKEGHTRRHAHTYIDIDTEIEDSNNQTNDSSHVYRNACPTCFLRKNNTVMLRLEAIKRQILTKLGLTERPKITEPIPRDILYQALSRADNGHLLDGWDEEESERKKENKEEILDNEPDDFYGKTSEIITFAEPGQRLNEQTLLEFSLSPESEPGVTISQLRVNSAFLYVRVARNRSISYEQTKRNMTIWVFKVQSTVANISYLSGKDFDKHTELVGTLSVALTNLGWQKIDITAAVRKWYIEGSFHQERLRLLVDCSGCNELAQILIFQQQYLMFGDRRVRSVDHPRSFGDVFETQMKNITRQSEKSDPNRPFLVVHTEPVATQRTRRRAVECSGANRGQCCKQAFYVSFKALQWHDWIIAPQGYYANYCQGDCDEMFGDPESYLNHHAHVLGQYQRLNRMTGAQACCAPTKYSGISLIYYEGKKIIKRDMPKMVVEQCGCP